MAALHAADSAAAGGAAAAVQWWRQGRCQLQFAVLLLLSVANISVSAMPADCCASVLNTAQTGTKRQVRCVQECLVCDVNINSPTLIHALLLSISAIPPLASL
jgi:hypothetical protein